MHSTTQRTIWSIGTILVLALLFTFTTAESAAAAPARRPPRPTPVATPAPASDPAEALHACASDIFGLDLSYDQAAGLTSTVARTLLIPSESEGTVTAILDAGATAIYGLPSGGGLQLLSYGSGTATSSDATVEVSKASLCYLQFNKEQAAPGSASDALSQLLATFPGVPQDAAYLASETTSGYRFVLHTTHLTRGGGRSSQTIVLSTISAEGSTIFTATSATGSYTVHI